MEKERVEGRQKVTRNSRTMMMMMMMMDELTFAPSKKSLSMDSFWCDEMAVSGTAAALERRLRKRIIVLWTRAGDSDVDVLAARLESRRFSCVTARRIFKVGVCPPPPPQKVKASVQIRRPKNFSLLFLLFLLFLLLLLFDIFQKTKDKERTKESKSFWKTRERQTFSRRLPFLSFLRSFTKKKLQIEAPLTSNINIMAKVRMTRTLFPWSRAFFSFSLALSEKRRTRAGERVVVGTFSARGPRGVRVKNVAEGNGKCFRIRSKKGARRMNARDARSDGRRRGVGTIRLDA